jgi:hypothetical protein
MNTFFRAFFLHSPPFLSFITFTVVFLTFFLRKDFVLSHVRILQMERFRTQSCHL